MSHLKGEEIFIDGPNSRETSTESSCSTGSSLTSTESGITSEIATQESTTSDSDSSENGKNIRKFSNKNCIN